MVLITYLCAYVPHLSHCTQLMYHCDPQIHCNIIRDTILFVNIRNTDYLSIIASCNIVLDEEHEGLAGYELPRSMRSVRFLGAYLRILDGWDRFFVLLQRVLRQKPE